MSKVTEILFPYTVEHPQEPAGTLRTVNGKTCVATEDGWGVLGVPVASGEELIKLRAEIELLAERLKTAASAVKETLQRVACAHDQVYYKIAADNYYCKACKQGMGQAYYKVTRELARLKIAQTVKAQTMQELLRDPNDPGTKDSGS